MSNNFKKHHLVIDGAPGRDRTSDLTDRNRTLYPLSYRRSSTFAVALRILSRINASSLHNVSSAPKIGDFRGPHEGMTRDIIPQRWH